MNGPGFYITGGKGFHLVFENGWAVSVQFGPGNYADHYDRDIGKDEAATGREGSRCAEVAVIAPTTDHLIDLGGDSVRGWQTPAAVLALLNAAANGDCAAGRIPPEERLPK